MKVENGHAPLRVRQPAKPVRVADGAPPPEADKEQAIADEDSLQLTRKRSKKRKVDWSAVALYPLSLPWRVVNVAMVGFVAIAVPHGGTSNDGRAALKTIGQLLDPTRPIGDGIFS